MGACVARNSFTRSCVRRPRARSSSRVPANNCGHWCLSIVVARSDGRRCMSSLASRRGCCSNAPSAVVHRHSGLCPNRYSGSRCWLINHRSHGAWSPSTIRARTFRRRMSRRSRATSHPIGDLAEAGHDVGESEYPHCSPGLSCRELTISIIPTGKVAVRRDVDLTRFVPARAGRRRRGRLRQPLEICLQSGNAAHALSAVQTLGRCFGPGAVATKSSVKYCEAEAPRHCRHASPISRTSSWWPRVDMVSEG